MSFQLMLVQLSLQKRIECCITVRTEDCIILSALDLAKTKTLKNHLVAAEFGSVNKSESMWECLSRTDIDSFVLVKLV